MSRPQSKYVRVSPQNPEGAGQCDRCGRWFNLRSMTFQYEWSGTHLYNTGKFVCTQGGCLDVPQEQFRTIILPPDPPPLLNARVPNFDYEEQTARIIQFSQKSVFPQVASTAYVAGTDSNAALGSVDGCNFRQVLLPGSLTSISGRTGRISILFGSDCPVATKTIDMAIGRAGAVLPNFAGDQVPITFNGGTTVPTGPGLEIVSDVFTLQKPFDATKTYIVSGYFKTFNVVPIGSNRGTGINSLSITVPAGGVPAGNALVVAAMDTSTAIGDITDSRGDGFLVISQNAPDGSTAFIGASANGSVLVQNDTITYTLGQSGKNATIEAFYATGVNIGLGNAFMDLSAIGGDTGTSSTPSVISGTPIEANEIAIAVVGSPSAVSSFTQDTINEAWSSPPGQVSIVAPTLVGGNVANFTTSAVEYAPLLGTSVGWASVMIALRTISSSFSVSSGSVNGWEAYISAPNAADESQLAEPQLSYTLHNQTSVLLVKLEIFTIGAQQPPWGAGPQMIRSTQSGEQARVLQYLTSS